MTARGYVSLALETVIYGAAIWAAGTLLGGCTLQAERAPATFEFPLATDTRTADGWVGTRELDGRRHVGDVEFWDFPCTALSARYRQPDRVVGTDVSVPGSEGVVTIEVGGCDPSWTGPSSVVVFSREGGS